MKKKVIAAIIIVVILALAGGTVYYLNDYYRADEVAVSLITAPKMDVTVTEENGVFVFSPQKSTTGIIFYPGGKVESKAYAPLMQSLAENGILCVLVTMPGNLAVLDMDAAEGLCEKFPQIESWYMAGHSLGGSMAASYIAENSGNFEGLILLASYSTADISTLELKAISVYGSNDGVLNMEKYSEYKPNLPKDFKEVVIEGGCHAYFGAYGEQEGDRPATITREEQIKITTEEIVNFIK